MSQSDRIIAVDFDGTIVEDKYPEIGVEIEGAFNALQCLRKLGWQIILYTMRTDLPNRAYLTEAVEFCKENDFEFDEINEHVKEVREHPIYKHNLARKIYATVYIDDRCVYVEDIVWKDILCRIIQVWH